MIDLTLGIFGSLTLLAGGSFAFLLKNLADKEVEIKSKNTEIEKLNKKIDDLNDLVYEAVLIIKADDPKTRIEKADQIIEKLRQLKN